MDNEPFSARLYELRQRLARIVVEHEAQHLGQYVDHEIAVFLATVPQAQAKRMRFAIDSMARGMMIPRSASSSIHLRLSQPGDAACDTGINGTKQEAAAAPAGDLT